MPNEFLTASSEKSVLLTRVEIERFKSVESQTIDLKPLTAVVGVNSAGKSTFIQAILMIIQHLQDEDSNEIQYSLNEHLIRLGTFAETLNTGHSAEIKDFRVALSMTFPSFGNRQELVTWDATLGADASTSSNSRFASVRRLYITGETRHHWRRKSGETVQGSDEATNVLVEGVTRPDLTDFYVLGDREFVRSAKARATLSDGSTDTAEYVFCPPGEQPTLYAEYTLAAYLLEHVRRSYVLARERELRGLRRDATDQDHRPTKAASLVTSTPMRNTVAPLIDRLEQELASMLEQIEDSRLIETESDSTTMGSDAIEALRAWPTMLDQFIFRVRPVDRSSGAPSPFSEEYSDVEKYFTGAVNKLVKGANFKLLGPKPSSYGSFVRTGSRSLKMLASKYLQKRAYYIGPIRDIDVEGDARPWRKVLGVKGEHTAAVLQRESRELLDNPPNPPGMRLSSREFQSVLAEWLRYLELADSIEQEERGRLKPGIKVRPLRRSGTVPLTAVGVGVSQVLPIVMQCLLASPSGSIVIVEQPELHLHPRIEVKLAEFFIACARTGRQIFIETHSEHLINRLRLEIASDRSGAAEDLISVLFARQNDTGQTQYDQAVINEFGGIDAQQWPEKFLDLSTEQSLELLKTAVARRAEASAVNDDDDELDLD